MRWNEVPKGASLAMSREAAMGLRKGGPKTFVSGMACGAIALLILQGMGDGSGDKPDKTRPSPSVTQSSPNKN